MVYWWLILQNQTTIVKWEVKGSNKKKKDANEKKRIEWPDKKKDAYEKRERERIEIVNKGL
jgi:hypothetical protein